VLRVVVVSLLACGALLVDRAPLASNQPGSVETYSVTHQDRGFACQAAVQFARNACFSRKLFNILNNKCECSDTRDGKHDCTGMVACAE
jgi:hypothetical protein